MTTTTSRDDADYELRERSAGKTAQGVILTVLGCMFAIPGAMLIIYGEHLLRKSEEEHGKGHVNVAIILGPILLLAGIALLITGLIICSSLNCKRSEDQRPIFSVDSEASLHIPQDNVSDCGGNLYGDCHWQGSGLPNGGDGGDGAHTGDNVNTPGTTELSPRIDLELGREEPSPAFHDHRMVLRLDPII